MPTDVEAVDVILGGIEGPPGPTGPPGPPLDPTTDLTVNSLIVTTDASIGDDLTVTGDILSTGVSISAPVGEMYAGAWFREAGRTVPVGHWANEPFNAANFSGSHTTWTLTAPDQVSLRYTLIGKTMMVAWNIQASSVGGPTTYLKIKIPGGFMQSTFASGRGVADYVNAGAPIEATGFAVVVGTTNFIQIYRDSFVNWTAATNNTSVRGNITFEIA